jgi:hypothetical protein
MKARAFGHSKEETPKEGPIELSEVTLIGSPDELRRIASFIQKSADEIEKHGDKFGHNHLQDEEDLKPWFYQGVDVIVARRA